MRPLAILLLAVTAPVWADEAADRAAIESCFRALNDAKNLNSMKALFTPDAEAAGIERLFQTHSRLIEAARRPWSELALPRVAAGPARFLTPDVALVDAA